MSTPHNPDRYGETWSQEKIDEYLYELEKLRKHIILSGGWAWHFMSPPGHTEYKHIHDHKDADIFVLPENVWIVIDTLQKQEFKKVKTRYDRLPSKEEFRRYEKTVSGKERPFRITIDFFVNTVPFIEVFGWKVVEPKHLLSLYSNIHSSDNCFAVQAASKLIEQEISPVLRDELIQIGR